jgi:hypothetical protein
MPSKQYRIAKKLWQMFQAIKPVIPSMPAIIITYILLKPVMYELQIGNMDFLSDWYWSNKYYTGYITLFFTNSQAFKIMLPSALLLVFGGIAFTYAFHRIVWSRLFPLYTMVQNDNEHEDRRVYWYEDNIWTRIGDKINHYFGIEKNRDTIRIYLRNKIINPYSPAASFICLKVPAENIDGRGIKNLYVKDNGVWIEEDRYNFTLPNIKLTNTKTDNEKLADNQEKAFKILAINTREGTKANVHILKKWSSESGGFPVDRNMLYQMRQRKEAHDAKYNES